MYNTISALFKNTYHYAYKTFGYEFHTSYFNDFHTSAKYDLHGGILNIILLKIYR
jgi:hypothetical protein